MSQVSTEFIPTRIAILTVSNRCGEEDEHSSLSALTGRHGPSRCR